jgi:hypothetical protein
MGAIGTNKNMSIMTPDEVTDIPPTDLPHTPTLSWIIAPKRGPNPNLNHSWGQPHQPPWGVDDTDSRHNYIKTPLDQYVKQTKVHVP